MKRAVIALVIALVIGGVAAGTAAARPAHAATPPPIAGHWVSTGCESRPAGGGQTNYIRRDFVNRPDGTWTGHFPIFADAGCTQPTLTFDASGRYRFEAPSTTVPGAWETYFSFDHIRITPEAAALVDYLNSAGPGQCGTTRWQLGVGQDVTATGCTVLGVDRVGCAGEYDLTVVDAHGLSYGARPADGGFLCTPARRPTALQVPVVPAQMVGMPRTGGAPFDPGLPILALILGGALVGGGRALRSRMI